MYPGRYQAAFLLLPSAEKPALSRFPPGAECLQIRSPLKDRSVMRYVFNKPCGFGPATDPVAKARMRVRASYLLSQWVQAPITDWREADT